MNETKCLIFDFDGVIVDSFRAAYKLAHAPLSVNTKSEFRGLFRGNVAKLIKAKLSPGGFKTLFNNYENAIPGMPIVPDIGKIIKHLNKNYLLAIVSSTTSSAIHRFLKSHLLDKYFIEILGIDSEPSKETKIRQLLQTHNLSAKDCLMITDTTGDIEEAKRVGVLTIGVTWGYHDEQMLRSANPTALARTPSELVQLVRELQPLTL